MTVLERVRLFWHTVRYLRSVQIYGRIRFRLARPRLDFAPAPPSRPRPGIWVTSAERLQSQLGPDAFCFLNLHGSLAAGGWDDPNTEKLWRYNLHYFDDLNAQDSGERLDWHQALMKRWIAENSAGEGTGWEPYPTSLRITNWIKWDLAGCTLSGTALQSLAVQTRWLSSRLEYHLLGNHLFANAKALVFAGLFFEGAEALGWLRRGCAILEREIPEQILEDGGHFELSPMYHALALEDMLDLLNLSKTFPQTDAERWGKLAETLPEAIAPMREWLVKMCHSDGEISFFNDAAFAIAPSPGEIEAYATRLGLPASSSVPPKLLGRTSLPESGYTRLEAGDAVAILDVGAVGPDYLPGHAHADTLSFELSLHGRRVLVNSGTSVYGTSAERLRQRGTSAHNTVVVAGKDSSEVWSGFRVARRARPFDLVFDDSCGFKVSCAHTGYRRLKGAPVHRRNWVLLDEELLVSDTLLHGDQTSEAHFHFHPDLVLTADDGGTSGHIESPDGLTFHWTVKTGEARLEPTSWHPQFGLSVSNFKLVVVLVQGESVVQFSWSDKAN